MKLAKRTLFVPKKKLEEFFGLPEGVEIMGVRPSSRHEQGWEFMLVSAGEVSVGQQKVTIFQDDNGAYRVISLDTLQEAEGDIVRNFIPHANSATYVTVEQSEANAPSMGSKIAEEILKGIRKQGR